MKPRFTLEESGQSMYPLTIHDGTIDEPIAWCLDRYEAEMVLAALNSVHPGIDDEEETGEAISP